MPLDLRPTLNFLRQLALHNDRSWFEAHREDYERAREAAEAFVLGLFPPLGIDRGSHRPSFWFHRIYRDVRFSKEKVPYKIHFSAVLDAGGKKATGLSPYLQLEPGGGSLLAGGLWAPEPENLKKFRLDMEDGPRAFLKILEAPEFRARLHLLEGNKLRKVPKGFPDDHPASELLRMRQVVAWRTFSDAEVLSPDFEDEVIATTKALSPFLRYLEESAGLVEPRD